ncbi:hypothetical protein DdX_20343 [Ditylenchus destructor]|uniref:Uncharacterized protein n=1 Tax=Ditylenchus destructor TaxID=166010 RepID=A0AAD4MLJ2_9BILA|nr:hypothetical protein DdX_20343 [Ditylenchus destructor]
MASSKFEDYKFECVYCDPKLEMHFSTTREAMIRHCRIVHDVEEQESSTAISMEPHKDDGRKDNVKKQNNKRRYSSAENQISSKKRAVVPGFFEELQQFTEESASSNHQIVSMMQKIEASNQERFLQIEARQDTTDRKLENLTRDHNKYTIRIEGIPVKAKDEKQTLSQIVLTCLLVNDFKLNEIREAKFLTTRNDKKTMLVTFYETDKKKRILDACKNLSDNKLFGTHKISISNQYSECQLLQKQATLATKKACEELSKVVPDFMQGNHLKVVGWNMLDEPKKNQAKHFSVWLQKLIDLSNKQQSGYACDLELFKTTFDKAKMLAKNAGYDFEKI